ncbi:hypothetical protein [Sphingosinicella ginsenosidimutans]|uniref:hypothetical protein n=1 Tax=Allosphingosinicella ginsenosidimutans TaxID=1176539 RepID=UPI0013152EE0|nr:hypothetical protein [Sphingosinicella ginsenosidimutans]
MRIGIGSASGESAFAGVVAATSAIAKVQQMRRKLPAKPQFIAVLQQFSAI